MGTELYDPIKTMSKLTDTVIVGFSGGKDSIVTLDLCTRYMGDVRAFFMYLVPGLEFQEEHLAWYERRYGIEITRMPRCDVAQMLRYGVYRREEPDVSLLSMNDMYHYVRALNDTVWIACGERAADSIVRNAMIKKSGSIDQKRGRFYPLAYWKKRHVVEYIRKSRLKLSTFDVKYKASFGSLFGDELSLIKELYPRDYEKILELFPFAEAAEFEYRVKRN